MKKKNIEWGKLNLKGLSEDNLNVYNTKHLAAIENGKNVYANKTKEEIEIVNKKKSESHQGLKESLETRIKKSNALKNKPKSKEHRRKLSIARTGFKESEETIRAKSLRSKGKKNPMFGKNHTKSTRKLISQNHASKVMLKCPHCQKECGANNYKRYHGDNCKIKKGM